MWLAYLLNLIQKDRGGGEEWGDAEGELLGVRSLKERLKGPKHAEGRCLNNQKFRGTWRWGTKCGGLEIGMVGSGAAGSDKAGRTETVFSFLPLLSLAAQPAAAPACVSGPPPFLEWCPQPGRRYGLIAPFCFLWAAAPPAAWCLGEHHHHLFYRSAGHPYTLPHSASLDAPALQFLHCPSHGSGVSMAHCIIYFNT